MALDVDGLDILKAIATRPEAFPDLRAEISRTGRALVVKQLKARNLTVLGLRLVRGSLGAETFSLVVDGLTDTEARGLAARFDRHHPDLKTAAADWSRRHLVALAAGTEPRAKPSARGTARPAGPGLAVPKSPSPGRALGSAAFSRPWDGKDHDPKPKKKKGG